MLYAEICPKVRRHNALPDKHNIIVYYILISNKGSGNFLPLPGIFNYLNSEKFVYDEEEKCDLLNKYFSFISKSRNRIDKIII